MATTTQIENKNVSQPQISNIQDLRKEINRVKASVKIKETELKVHLKKFPEEAMIYAGQASLKLIIKKGVPTRLIGVVSNVIGLIMAIQKQKKGVEGAIAKAKEFAMYTALNRLASWFQKKRRRVTVT